MSPSTDDNLGRRRFLLFRDKAVEFALERIRHSPEAEWEKLSPEERAGLKDALTEIWENCKRERWQQFSFSIVNRSDILALITLGNEIRARHNLTDMTRAAVEAILLSPDNPDLPH
jgi:hypothetical protein